MPQFGGKNAKKKTSSSSTKRHFTVVMGNKEHGLYVSSSPSSAARKAVTKLCATDKKRKVKFSIREITQGSKKKTYGPYDGYIEKLKEPVELKGRVIKYKPVAKLSRKTGAKKGGGGSGVSNPYTYSHNTIKLSPFLSPDEETKKRQINYLYTCWNCKYRPMGYNNDTRFLQNISNKFSTDDKKKLKIIFDEELINMTTEKLIEYKQQQPEGKYFQ
jgi:hypothetical protein